MIPDKKRSHPPAEEVDPMYGQEDVASFTECTGIAPLGLQDGWQQNNVAALYAIHNTRQRRDEDDPMDDEDWPK